MDDSWYYAEGDKPVGPISRADLVAILSRVSGAGNALVWREGFPNWIRAKDVSELIPAVTTPPASPVSLPRSIQKSKAILTSRAAGEVYAKHESTEEKYSDPVGFGGWLILVAIGQILGPLMFVDHLFKYYLYLDGDLWTQFPITYYGEAVLNLSVLAIIGWTTYCFFTKSRWFPVFFSYECAAYILLYPLGIAFKAVTLIGYGLSVHIPFESKPFVEWIATIIIATVWISYIKLSKRVANTFRTLPAD